MLATKFTDNDHWDHDTRARRLRTRCRFLVISSSMSTIQRNAVEAPNQFQSNPIQQHLTTSYNSESYPALLEFPSLQTQVPNPPSQLPFTAPPHNHQETVRPRTKPVEAR